MKHLRTLCAITAAILTGCASKTPAPPAMSSFVPDIPAFENLNQAARPICAP